MNCRAKRVRKPFYQATIKQYVFGGGFHKPENDDVMVVNEKCRATRNTRHTKYNKRRKKTKIQE